MTNELPDPESNPDLSLTPALTRAIAQMREREPNPEQFSRVTARAAVLGKTPVGTMIRPSSKRSRLWAAVVVASGAAAVLLMAAGLIIPQVQTHLAFQATASPPLDRAYSAVVRTPMGPICIARIEADLHSAKCEIEIAGDLIAISAFQHEVQAILDEFRLEPQSR